MRSPVPGSPTRDRPRIPGAVRLLGPLLFLLLLGRVDLAAVARALAAARPAPLLAAVALFAPLWIVKAARWRTILRSHGASVDGRTALRLYVLASGFGGLSPGNVGDLAKGLSRSLPSRRLGLWTSVADRLWDVAALAVLGVAVLAVWFARPAAAVAAGGLLLAAAVAGWASRARLARRLLPALPEDAPVVEPVRAFASCALATATSTVIAVARFGLLVRALALPIEGPAVLVAFVLSAGVVALPLSVAGVGTRDAVLLAFLGGAGVPPSDVLALSLLCLGLIVWNGVVAAVWWLVRPPEVA